MGKPIIDGEGGRRVHDAVCMADNIANSKEHCKLVFWSNLDTVNREYFDVKIFSDSMACAKINARNTCAILTTMRYRVVCPKNI